MAVETNDNACPDDKELDIAAAVEEVGLRAVPRKAAQSYVKYYKHILRTGCIDCSRYVEAARLVDAAAKAALADLATRGLGEDSHLAGKCVSNGKVNQCRSALS